MAGALEAPLLRAAVGRRAGPGFGMVAAGHQAFRRGIKVYFGWIWLLFFFLWDWQEWEGWTGEGCNAQGGVSSGAQRGCREACERSSRAGAFLA